MGFTKIWRNKANRIWLLTFVSCFLLLVFGIFAVHKTRAYTSDDVIIQTVMHQHTHLVGQGTAWLGEDNYFFKLPYYLIVNGLFTNSRKILLLTALLFNIGGLLTFFYSSLYFFKRFKLKQTSYTLALIWLFSLTFSLATIFLINPNLRNLEIGISFVILMLIARYTDGELAFNTTLRRFILLSLALAMGLFLYSDPFFVYMLLFPLLVFLSLRLFFGKFDKRLVRAIGFLFASAILMVGWHKFAAMFHINNRHVETSFVTISQFWQTADQAFRSYFTIFGASFWGHNFWSIATFSYLLNCCLMLVGIITPLVLVVNKKLRPKDTWLIFWLIQPLFVTSLYVLSTNTALNLKNTGAIRFFVLVPFYFPVILATAYKRLPNQRVRLAFVLVTVTAIVLNTGRIFSHSVDTPPVRPNTQNYQVVEALEHEGLNKGYAGYWESSINTYLSNNHVNVIPTNNCSEIQHLLMDDKAVLIHEQKSYYIYNPEFAENCSQAGLVSNFGIPNKIVKAGADLVYIYNYDITIKMTNGYFR